MRIALLTRRFDPAGGGTERDLMVTAECLRRAGHELTIYAGEVRGPASGLTVREIGGARLPRALVLARFGFGAPAAARRAGADLVLSFARVADADVMRSGGAAHISYLRAARRWRGRMAGAAMRLAPYHRMQMLLERRAFRSPRLRLTIAVSNLVRDDLIDVFKLAPGLVATLYNGVDLQRFHPPSDPRERDEVRAHFKIPRDVALVAFIGNGFARKGVGGLVEAWRMLSGAPHLLVVGADRALESYRRRADELGVGQRITFAGAQPDVAAILRAADALALPSLFEPFGNVALEAMASGIPALTSVHCGVSELQPAPMRAYIVERSEDSGEIALRLGALLDARGKLGKIAREAAEQFSWERYARELLALIERAR